jgi:hypothetical protein
MLHLTAVHTSSASAALWLADIHMHNKSAAAASALCHPLLWFLMVLLVMGLTLTRIEQRQAACCCQSLCVSRVAAAHKQQRQQGICKGVAALLLLCRCQCCCELLHNASCPCCILPRPATKTDTVRMDS